MEIISSDPLAALFDIHAEPKNRARVGIALLRNTPSADHHRRAAAQEGLEMLLADCDAQLSTRVHSALLRYGARSTQSPRPRFDIRDSSVATQRTIREHYGADVYTAWIGVNLNSPRFCGSERWST